MNRPLAILAVLTLNLSTARAELAPEKPTFCAGYTAKTDDSNARYADSYLKSEGLGLRTLNLMASAACDKPDDPARQKQVADWRQILIDEWGLAPELTWKVLETRFKKEEFEKELKAYCGSWERSSEDSSKDKAVKAAWAMLANCANEADIEFFVDETAETPEVWRAAFVADCFRPQGLSRFEAKDDTFNGMKSIYSLTRYVTCGIDARRMDQAKFEEELAAEKAVTPMIKVVALENFQAIKAWAGKHTDWYKKASEKDEELKAVLFDVPEAAFAEWQKKYEAKKADFNKVIDVERKAFGPSLKAVRGCGPELRKVFAKHVAAVKPDDPENAERVLLDPFGYRLINALAFCEQAEGNHLAAWTLYYAQTSKGISHRGPRMAATHAALRKIDEVLADRPKFTQKGASPKMIDMQPGSAIQNIDLNKETGSPAAGQIASMKPTGDHVLITFKKLSWTENTYDCVDTNKLDYVDYATGKVYYKQKCKVTGKEKFTSQEKPIKVVKEYASGLKKGQFLMFYGVHTTAKERNGFPRFGYKDTKKKKLLSVFGAKI